MLATGPIEAWCHRLRRRLAAAAIGCAAAVIAPGAAASAMPAAPGAEPPFVTELFHLRLDDPQAGLVWARRRLAASLATPDPEAQFWLHLGLSDLHVELEQGEQGNAELAAARRLLGAGALDDTRHRLWLEMRAIGASAQVDPLPVQRRRVEALQYAAQMAGAELLLCQFTNTRAYVLHASEANTEAWAAAEDAERCGRRFGDPRFEIWGLYWRATLANRVHNAIPAPVFLARAMGVLERVKARQLRATLLGVMAAAADEEGQSAQALAHLGEMLAICRQLGDLSGAGLALADQARIRLARGDLPGALANARDAAGLLQPPRPIYRWVRAQALLVELTARLGGPGLAGEMARLQAADPATLTLREKADIALSLSKGHAALGRSGPAYEELLRYVALKGEIDAAERATEVRGLAARYQAAARDAENEMLRHRAEAARLALMARDERQRALLALLVALTVLLLVAAGYGWRVLRSRRQMADLAVRDELTGRPNRRAIVAFGRQQLALAGRLGLPFSVAMLDLDHFKVVNDSHGHAAGDAVLKAFGDAAGSVLRGQDLLGRFGGEEWLLVMPGTYLGDVAEVFGRLRSSFAAQRIEGLPFPHGITFSMGGAAPETPVQTLDALIERADRCLYAAKQSGRDKVCVSPSARPEPVLAAA
ncbi:MAG TPA: GGDEF domain-containing protein [Ideonella sp.]|nr:GGDEF domain-containing protein [Ideonella sp.]